MSGDGVKTSSNNSDTHFIAISIVQSKTPNNLGFRVNGLAHQFGGSRGLLQLQVGRTGDVDQRTVCTFDAFLKQRRADGDFGGLRGTILSPCGTDTKQRSTSTTKNGVHIVEVDVNIGVHRNQVSDALNTGKQCGISGLEGLNDADGTVGKLEQAIVRNDDQRVDFLAQVVDAVFGGSGTLRAFEAERTSNNRDGESTLLMSRTSDDRAGASTGATALAAGDEHHVGTPKRLFDIRLVVLGRLGSTLRVGTSTETTTGLIGKGNLDIRIRAQKILRIGIYRHKFNIL